MIKYKEIYKRLKEKRKNRKASNSNLSREGYGYIKRRMGLLSNEVGKPTYSLQKEKPATKD